MHVFAECGHLWEKWENVPMHCWGNMPTGDAQRWLAIGCDCEICSYWQDKYNIVVAQDGGSWGSLPKDLQESWNSARTKTDACKAASSCSTYVEATDAQPPSSAAATSAAAAPAGVEPSSSNPGAGPLTIIFYILQVHHTIGSIVIHPPDAYGVTL